MFECCFGMCWYANWAKVGVLCVRLELELCKSHPSESISPKQELQSLMFGLVHVSRPGDSGQIERLGLSLRRETFTQARSRSDLGILSAISRPGERFWSFERLALSPKREWLA